jgi:hypothetical protein
MLPGEEQRMLRPLLQKHLQQDEPEASRVVLAVQEPGELGPSRFRILVFVKAIIRFIFIFVVVIIVVVITIIVITIIIAEVFAPVLSAVTIITRQCPTC